MRSSLSEGELSRMSPTGYFTAKCRGIKACPLSRSTNLGDGHLGWETFPFDLITPL